MCFEFELSKQSNQYCCVMQSDSRICIRAQNNVSFIHFYLHSDTSMNVIILPTVVFVVFPTTWWCR